MAYGTQPFGTASYGLEPDSGGVYSAAVGTALGAASAAGVGAFTGPPIYTADPHWGETVFLSHFNYATGAGAVIDETGHTVVHSGTMLLVTTMNGPANTALGGYGARSQAGTVASGYHTYIDGLLPEFSGFSTSDTWTIEFRTTTYGSFGIGADLFAIQPNSSARPLLMQTYNVDGVHYGIRCRPQGSSVEYETGAIAVFGYDYEWINVVVECDAGTLHIAVNGTPATLTTATSFYYTSAVANALTFFAPEKTATFSTAGYIDELRITKAARYGGSGYPASFTEFPDPSSAAAVSGTATAVGEAFGAFAGSFTSFGTAISADFTAAGDSAAAGVGGRVLRTTCSMAGTSSATGYSLAPATTVSPAAGSTTGVSSADFKGRSLCPAAYGSLGAATATAFGAGIFPSSFGIVPAASAQGAASAICRAAALSNGEAFVASVGRGIASSTYGVIGEALAHGESPRKPVSEGITVTAHPLLLSVRRTENNLSICRR